MLSLLHHEEEPSESEDEEAVSPAIARVLAAHGGEAVHWLCQLLARGDRRSKQWSGACLCNLAQCPTAKAELCKNNIVGIIHKVLCKTNAAGFEAARSEGLQELLLGLLCNLALDDNDQSVRGRIVRGGAMNASIMLLHSDDAYVQDAAAAALVSITTVGNEDEGEGLPELIKQALREPHNPTALVLTDLTDLGDLDATDQALTQGERTTPMQSLAECALESESEVIRETAQLVLDNLKVDVTIAANEKHFTAVTQ